MGNHMVFQYDFLSAQQVLDADFLQGAGFQVPIDPLVYGKHLRYLYLQAQAGIQNFIFSGDAQVLYGDNQVFHPELLDQVFQGINPSIDAFAIDIFSFLLPIIVQEGHHI